jgi:hypothetical protein
MRATAAAVAAAAAAAEEEAREEEKREEEEGGEDDDDQGAWRVPSRRVVMSLCMARRTSATARRWGRSRPRRNRMEVQATKEAIPLLLSSYVWVVANNARGSHCRQMPSMDSARACRCWVSVWCKALVVLLVCVAPPPPLPPLLPGLVAAIAAARAMDSAEAAAAAAAADAEGAAAAVVLISSLLRFPPPPPPPLRLLIVWLVVGLGEARAGRNDG